MGNAALLYRNLADDAVISASSELVLAPGSKVQNPDIARKWRSASSGDWLLADFGALTSMDTVAVIGLTATTCRVRLSSTDPTGVAGDIYDSGVDAVDQDYLQAIVLIGAPVSARFLRIDLTNGTAGATYVEAGRLVAGLRSRFGINFGFGWSKGYVDPSILTKTRGGQTQVSAETSYRVLDLTFEMVSPSDRRGFIETVDRVNGKKLGVLFVLDDESSDLAFDTIWGLVSELTPVTQPYLDRFSKQYRIEERL